MNDCINERISEETNQSMNERIIEETNESINERTNDDKKDYNMNTDLVKVKWRKEYK